MTTIKTSTSLSTHFSRLASALRGLALALLLSTSLLDVGSAIAAEQKTFATPEAAVSALIDALKEQPAPGKPLFEPGDHLKVVEGPFTGIQAELLRVYEMPDGEARVMVHMEIMSRPQQVSLPASIVRQVK